MYLVRSILCAFVALLVFSAQITVTQAAFGDDPVNSRLERLNRRNAKIRSRVIRNSRSRMNFGYGARKTTVNDVRKNMDGRRLTIREYKLLIRRPSLRALHLKPVSRSRTERMKSADAYNERLKRALANCSAQHRSRYDRNNCIRRVTRGTRTFE